ncbi:iron-sulfur cluster assembly protein [Nocardioides panaciterrulae]|uniref:Metal-sulfur cluster biosynthetic enzyme n=1 Tax=Nocardioides panaciterrulae TaxID=661492 RepID=A0A7Y9JCE7_9ACTN|nr:iron-sulfur cluster assembly protein [Nocardioides panaciterrulae]NYD43176.1 metal-sulfur cluster biosynthetic enzyme [Nocardioides panaciterrulae]
MGAAPAPAYDPGTARREEAYAALGQVMDPELDEPITDLGFVRSLELTGEAAGDLEVHLRLPTSFCSPNFAYLMASDAKDVLTALPWARRVVVELDDHHDSDLINRGLAADAGYLGTFRHEAEHDLEELRMTFRRKAHAAAMERCLTGLLRRDPDRPVESLGGVTLGELPQDRYAGALRRRRSALGLPDSPDAPVLVDHTGRGYPPEEVPLALRRARSTRISIDGNAHFCRGLLRTRYPGSDADQVPRPDGAEQADDPTFIPLTTLVPAAAGTTRR